MILQPNKEKQTTEKKINEPFCYYWKAHDLYRPKESSCVETIYNKTTPLFLTLLEEHAENSGIFCHLGYIQKQAVEPKFQTISYEHAVNQGIENINGLTN